LTSARVSRAGSDGNMWVGARTTAAPVVKNGILVSATSEDFYTSQGQISGIATNAIVPQSGGTKIQIDNSICSSSTQIRGILNAKNEC
jgi:hypothetical protein